MTGALAVVMLLLSLVLLLGSSHRARAVPRVRCGAS